MHGSATMIHVILDAKHLLGFFCYLIETSLQSSYTGSQEKQREDRMEWMDLINEDVRDR